MLKTKKGQAFVFFIFILGLFVIGFAITILMKPLSDVYNRTYNETVVMEDDYQKFFTRSQTVWLWTPFIIAIAMLFWTLIKAHEKNQYG